MNPEEVSLTNFHQTASVYGTCNEDYHICLIQNDNSEETDIIKARRDQDINSVERSTYEKTVIGYEKKVVDL